LYWQLYFFIYFRRVYLLLVWVAVRVLNLSLQKCLNFHFFIYFRRLYLLLVCVALWVLKSTVQKCLNVDFFLYFYTRLKYIKKWKFKHFCTDNFNTRTATQTRSKYTRLKYIKKWMFKHFCTVNFNTRNATQLGVNILDVCIYS
jgi:hypothetical protein